MAKDLQDVRFKLRRAIDKLFDDLSWDFDIEDNETVFKALQEDGYSDLADAWFNWCSDGDEGWPNENEVVDD